MAKMIRVAVRSPRSVYQEIRVSSKTPEFMLGLQLGLIIASLLAALICAVQPLIG